jgi:hypothetical protein
MVKCAVGLMVAVVAALFAGPSSAGAFSTRPSSSLEVDVTLTAREAFLVMTDFIWRFAQSAGDDLITLLGDTELEADGQPSDAASWEDWMASVSRIRDGDPPRSGAR